MVSASGPSGGAAARRVSTEGSGASLEEILADSDAPFLSLDTPMNAYEWLKICLCLPNILWRTLLTAIILPLVWLYMAILTVKLPLNQPLPRCGRCLRSKHMQRCSMGLVADAPVHL